MIVWELKKEKNMNVYNIIGRCSNILETEISKRAIGIEKLVKDSKFLVVGGAGTIGQAVVKELFRLNPKKLHVIDISENNLVELVRDLRSSEGYNCGEFDIFALDVGSPEFDKYLLRQTPFDYVLNLSALKHVRSEKDPYTLTRMIEVNIINSLKLQQYCEKNNAQKYFCVSTDKAANPANLMGASKRIMEVFLKNNFVSVPVSMARFANVAFSDGSLLHGFHYRIMKRQPLSAPSDIKRYFLTDREAGQLCLLSCLLGENGEIFFPKHRDEIKLRYFSDIAEAFLKSLGKSAVKFNSENDARMAIKQLDLCIEWPCYFFKSDTTGEKPYEEFYTDNEELDLERFENIGVIKHDKLTNHIKYKNFIKIYKKLTADSDIKKVQIVDLFKTILPDFIHDEKNKNLNDRM